MKSMTGYGRAVKEDGTLRIEVEIRCLNGRLFNLSSRLTQELTPYESEIKQIIAQKISRGNVTVNLAYQDTSVSAPKINRHLLQYYYEELCQIAKSLNTAPPSLDTVLQIEGIVATTFRSALDDAKWEQVRTVVGEALAAVEEMRQNEGALLGQKIYGYWQEISTLTETIEKLAPKVVDTYHERLKKRLMELSNSENFRYTPDDILKEVAIFTEKADITEEIVRLKSHLNQCLEYLQKQEPIGKAMEFVLQEIVRESNTIAAKANDIDCIKATINIKNVVEKLREQIQNVE